MSFVRAFSFLTVVSVVTYTLLSVATSLSGGSPAVQKTHQIPSFGLGTWLAGTGEVKHAVEYALKKGYRHIDAAAIYRNEEEVGQGIKASGISRDEIWVTSKLWNTDHRPELVRKAIEKSIANLGVEYLDLYLIHWPVAWVPGTKDLDNGTSIVDTWKAMEELVRDGLTRNIGISNFSPKDIKKILQVATIRPYAHEFETHPYLQQQSFVDFHASENIKVIAYSPLANTNPVYDPDIPSILHDEFWAKLAESKNATVAQAVLAWGLQRGTIVIPKSTHEKYIDENFGSQNITFTEDELKKVAEQDKKYRFNNPAKSWGVDLFEGLDGGPEKKEEEDDRNEEL
ncbi:glycerol dehydrogenase [Fusarium beomiforme]|uniref:Glycerol dehydrogenase n=1 Tax=Fusarium beomiforme TaxID=44412 RepID=A0A9P5AF90_9HYPO|nr:glycerol dehydrogenase [Fusarium beomiforme]